MRKIFDAKGRPPHHPVIVHLDSPKFLHRWVCEVPASASRLAERFWPGALTIVVQRRPGLDWALGARSETIGLRVPNHAAARALCIEVGALATTSANLHGEPPCTDPDAVRRTFGPGVVVVNGGHCAGAPSTVVSVLGDRPRCLREGAVPWADVEDALGID